MVGALSARKGNDNLGRCFSRRYTDTWSLVTFFMLSGLCLELLIMLILLFRNVSKRRFAHFLSRKDMKYFVRYKTNVEVNADVGENLYQECSKIFMNIEREIAVLIWELLSTSVVEFFFFFLI